MKAFSIIIPPYQLEKEKYVEVNQLLKCYKFDRTTDACTANIRVCSRCAEEGHTHKHCNSNATKCLNCGGNHVAVSFSCLTKKSARNAQTSQSNPINTEPTNTENINPSNNYNAPSITTQDPPHMLQLQPMQHRNPNPKAVKISANINGGQSSNLCSFRFLHRGIQQTFATIFLLLLEANNLPTIAIPESIIKIAEKKGKHILPDNSSKRTTNSTATN